MDRNTKNVLISAISGFVASILVVGIAFFVWIRPLETELPTVNDASVSSSSLSKILKDKDYVSEEDLRVAVVDKVSPAVVSIVITKDVPVLEKYYADPFGSHSDSPFGGMPGFSFRVPQYRDSGETEEKKIGGGSGFFVNSDGYIVTNKHVVDEPDAEYTVFTKDGDKYTAKVIDKDALNDIAILKVDGKDFPYLDFADSDSVKPGQTAIAIGNPLMEFENSVSVGIVSGLSRNIVAGTRFVGGSEYLEDVIQTDAAINPGNSGGPLLNLDGKVIGVNVAMANGQNIGFSIPASTVSALVDSVMKNGRIVRPFLGIRYVPITPELKEKNNLSVDYGVIVMRGDSVSDLAVVPGSPADKAGIVENDIILEVDGEKIKDKSLAKTIASKKIGDSVKLKLLHKGEEKVVTVVLEENKMKDEAEKKPEDGEGVEK